MITLFWYPQTRASRILWLLNEMDQPFEVRTVDIRNPESIDDEDFRAASPMGKVPAIMDESETGRVCMAESAAIALYLADRYPSSKLAPAADHPARGNYLYWMTYTPAAIEPSMMEKFGNWEVNRASSGWGNWDEMIRVLEDGVRAGPWVMGETFTAADVLLGSSVYFMRAFGLLGENAVLNAYADRCLERPAYQKALAFDDETQG